MCHSCPDPLGLTPAAWDAVAAMLEHQGCAELAADLRVAVHAVAAQCSDRARVVPITLSPANVRAVWAAGAALVATGATPAVEEAEVIVRAHQPGARS